MWKNSNDIPFILAADDSPGKPMAREISVDNGAVTVNKVPINASSTVTGKTFLAKQV
jgi:hypothetical protein